MENMMRLADAANTYACKGDICYGVGSAMDAQFRALQTLINVFAKRDVFAPLVVDGKIGPKTVFAIKVIGGDFGGPVGATLMTLGATPEFVAQNTQQIGSLLQQVALHWGLKAPPAGSLPSPPQPGTMTPPPGPGSMLPLPPGAKKSKLPWIIGGAIVAAALVGGYFIVTGPQAAAPSDE